MTKVSTAPFDPADYLDGDEAAAAYMSEALATNRPGVCCRRPRCGGARPRDERGGAPCRCVPRESVPGARFHRQPRTGDRAAGDPGAPAAIVCGTSGYAGRGADGMRIRDYQPPDLDAVIAVFIGAIREIAARDYTPAQIDAWAQVDRDAWAARRLSRPTWVAIMRETVVGFTDLEPDGHLDMMFVHPAHQRAGIATALLATVEAARTRSGLFRGSLPKPASPRARSSRGAGSPSSPASRSKSAASTSRTSAWKRCCPRRLAGECACQNEMFVRNPSASALRIAEVPPGFMMYWMSGMTLTPV